MSANHLPLEPPPAWSWQLPTEQHAGMFFTQQHYRQRAQNMLAEGNCEREHLFEKPLTPSDVGKLNRLVIPKQHAEKYFPLDGDSGEKGLLLSFEDESGKAWRFRYSYWTSSQSYVLTKGWSRFVKEKRLDAGDVVLFERRRSGADRLFIGWRRRAVQDNAAAQTANAPTAQLSPVYYSVAAAAPPPFHPYSYPGGEPQDCLHEPDEHAAGQAQNTASAPPAVATNSKRLRLFGVNLDCVPEQEQEQVPEPEPEPEAEPRRPSSSSNSPCMEGSAHGRSRARLQFMPGGGSFY